MTVSVILLIFKHRSDSVFDKSSDKEISEMSCEEYPVRTGTNKSTRGEKEGGKLTTTTNN